MTNNQTKLTQNSELSLYTTIKNILGNINYINFGIITKVTNNDYVNIKLYIANYDSSIIEINAVRLLHLGTSTVQINIIPKVGDIVLLLCTKDFVDLLEFDHTPAAQKIFSIPYDNATMNAILVSPHDYENNDNLMTLISIDENNVLNIKTENDASIYSKATINSYIEDKDNNVKSSVLQSATEVKIDINSKGSVSVKESEIKAEISNGTTISMNASQVDINNGALVVKKNG